MSNAAQQKKTQRKAAREAAAKTRYDEWIEKNLAEAPPLTPEQKARIASILMSGRR